MSWVLLILGLALAFAGSATAAAVVTTAQVDLAEAISRRLRGTRESLGWLAITEREVVTATATASFGVGLVGAAIPGLFSHSSVLELVILVLFLAVPVALLGGYLLPRWLTVPRAARALEHVRPLLSGWTAILGVVLPSRHLDETDEVKTLVREGGASGVSSDELVMVGGVLSFGVRAVREVMTPRTNVVAVPRNAERSQLASVFAESGYTRVPVYGDSLDEIVGMIHAFDLFKYQPGDDLPLRQLAFVPERRTAGDVLLDMQRNHQHLAVVVDEFGGTAGIVTLEDLLEGLVGEIADEDDALPPPPVAGLSMIELDGAAPASRVLDELGVGLPASDATSIGGLLATLIGRIPAAGERFSIRGLEIDILQASATRVERVLVRKPGSTSVSLDRAVP